MSYLNKQRRFGIILAASLAAIFIFNGCNSGSHPDDKAAVYNALQKNELGSVMVAQDRHAGTITLSGIVGGPRQKNLAFTVAQQAAPRYTITNNIRVDTTGLTASTADPTGTSIENQFKAQIEKNQKLKEQKIQYTATNGTLVLKGVVRTEAEKQEAEELAKKVPHVQRVVNDIQVRRGHTPRPAPEVR
jgi:hyperosmotically inducible periplasmic protein